MLRPCLIGVSFFAHPFSSGARPYTKQLYWYPLQFVNEEPNLNITKQIATGDIVAILTNKPDLAPRYNQNMIGVSDSEKLLWLLTNENTVFKGYYLSMIGNNPEHDSPVYQCLPYIQDFLGRRFSQLARFSREIEQLYKTSNSTNKIPTDELARFLKTEISNQSKSQSEIITTHVEKNFGKYQILHPITQFDIAYVNKVSIDEVGKELIVKDWNKRIRNINEMSIRLYQIENKK